ncbi:MAG: hypothetical protein E7158_01315 [Firmicutes bacterium]|nr:hypothetical protein [Bacillota bacterium]
MKIFCHNGVLPNVGILNQYGINIQDTFKSGKEWERDALIIEIPDNLKIVRGRDLPQVVSVLKNVIIDENGNIICSLDLSDVNYQYESENVPEDKMYDYHCFGTPKFYSKKFPSLSQLDSMSREDMDEFMEILDEMMKAPVQSEERSINNYIEKTPISSIITPKEINEVEVPRDLPINNSILVDDNKTLNLVRQTIDKRGFTRFFADVPESFDEIDRTTFTQMREIDQAHQHSFISRDTAISMIADLFERRGFCNRFEKYIDSVLMARLKELFELLEIKYQDLLHALNTGKIDQTQFEESIKKLRELETNSMKDIITQNETLKGNSK